VGEGEGLDAMRDNENGSSPTDHLGFTPQWYAVHTRARHEKKVRDQLVGRSVEVFLPTYDHWSHWKNRRMKLELPLFPGYCFGRFPLVDRLRVLTVPGVADLVGTNGRPEVVPEREIAAVRRVVESEVRYDPHPFLSAGIEVEVVRGPLAGVRGTLLRKDRAARLVLSVTLLRQAAVVEVHPADVVPT
jgi:transcription antitermination factor NusG